MLNSVSNVVFRLYKVSYQRLLILKMTSISSCPSSSSTKDSTDTREEGKETAKQLELCPFKLLWSFGMNPEVPLINLTTKNRTMIAYACSHIVMLYNYKTKKAITLQGHEHTVKTLSTSKDGKWLLSADFENDHVIVVWDTETGVPICTLFTPHGEHYITAATISPDAKYIVTVGNERFQKVQFWLWTYGNDEPHASLELTETSVDRMKEISFNEDLSEEFVLTGESNVVFISWEESQLNYHCPKIVGNTRRYGLLNCSCIAPNVQRAFTATSNGYVLIWHAISEKERSKNKEKMTHVKSMRLQKCSLNVILHYNGLIIVGTAGGQINFYDLQLKLIYWIHNFGISSIRSISFKLPSTLLGPTITIGTHDTALYDTDDFMFDEEEEVEDEEHIGRKLCKEKIEYLKMTETEIVSYEDDASSTIAVNLEYMYRDYGNKQEPFIQPRHIALDATYENAPFYVDSFFVSSSTGAIALVDISTLKCQFFSHDIGLSVTSVDAHPRSNYIVTGNAQGMLCLYEYKKRKLIVRRNTPPLPDFRQFLEKQVKTGNITYVTCPQSRDELTAISVLKYSPLGDQLVCGLDNGTLWILHPLTLETLHNIPYKHSSESIIKLIFTECAEYMAYSDNKLVVAVFKRNDDILIGDHPWNFLGKYRTHVATITDILFGPATSNSITPRLFSLGEDKKLVEYDLKNSGPYPDPGLIISEICQIEYSAVPLCLAWYPNFGIEQFLMISTSEYKYRLLNDVTKIIRGTFLGPMFGAPVQHYEILSSSEYKKNRYVLFATEKEFGLQILPFDGNPYKTLGMIGHPRKITNIRINCDGNTFFTSGYNDPCVLMWEIKCSSVDVLEILGGQGLSPYYCLLEGGRKGWLINEMKDLFYYAQILHQGENTPVTRIVSEKVNIKQIPNLMRAIGFYPTNEDIEILMNEVCYRTYAETGKITEEITFEEFVKYYINHRPAFGISLHQLQEAFQTFVNPDGSPFLDEENPVLTRNQFLNVLFGKGPVETPQHRSKDFGEPLTLQEAYMHLKLLVGCDNNEGDALQRDKAKRSILQKLTFLPERISYKDLITDIMGIELPEETKADDE